jgi:O-antigen ligase
MELINYLGLLALLSYFVVLVSTRQIRKSYLLFCICCIPLIDIPVTPAEFGSLKVFDAVSYITVAALFKDFVVVRQGNKFYFNLYCLLILLLVMGSLASEFVMNSLFSIFSIFPVFIFAKLLIDECASNENFKNDVILFVKFAGFFSILFLFIQMYIGLDFTFYPRLNANTTGSGGLRYPSYFHDPQKYAQFLAILSILYLFDFKSQKITYLSVFLFVLSAIALFLTGSRSALIGLCAGLLILFIFLDLRLKLTMLACLILGGIPLIYFSDVFLLLNRIGEISGDYEFRYSVWRGAYEIFTKHPILGIGIGNYQSYARHYSLDQYFIFDNEVSFFDQPENGYLKILVEYGLPATIIFFSFLILPIGKALITYINGKKNPANIFSIASLVGWLFSFNSVYSFADRRVMILIISLAAFLIISNSREVASDEK